MKNLATVMEDLDNSTLIEECKQNLDADAYEKT